MSIAYRVQDYIAEHGLVWRPVGHRASQSSMETAHYAHVPPDRLAKAIVLEDREGYLVAVVAAHRRIDVEELSEALGRDLWLAAEPELLELFSDCALGAVPAVGEAYGLPTFWDEKLAEKPDVYFEGGDHCTLVQMTGADFSELMRSAQPLRLH